MSAFDRTALGALTAEHDIGSGKIKFLRGEAGPAVDVMRRIKAVLDPLGIMNPGKIFR
jgi:D-lactate dehydrogenase (cytochrome)